MLCWAFPVGLSLYLTKTAPAITRRVPTNLNDLSVAETAGTKISYLPTEFEVPWTDFDESQTKVETTPDHQMEWICFRSGLKLFVWVTPSGKTAFNYVFLKRAYQLTPDKIRYWSTSSYQDQILLRLKASFLEDIGMGMSSNPAESGVFNVEAQGYKGFQYGDPKARPSMIEIRLYDQENGVFEIKFLQMAYDEAAGVTQPEINRVVQSVHKIVSANSVGRF